MKMTAGNCLICQRITEIKQGKNPYFVTQLKTGYVVLGDHQYFKGYTLFLYKDHYEELHELPRKERDRFLKEMVQVGHAVWKAFKPKKLNYELLGNKDAHLHWHIFPRYKHDPVAKKPIWVLPETIRLSPATIPSSAQLKQLKQKLFSALAKNNEK